MLWVHVERLRSKAGDDGRSASTATSAAAAVTCPHLTTQQASRDLRKKAYDATFKEGLEIIAANCALGWN